MNPILDDTPSINMDVAAHVENDSLRTVSSSTPVSDNIIAAESPETPEVIVHPNIKCYGQNCPNEGKYMSGIRYMCSVCHNTDFCSFCEPSHDHSHPRIAYRRPKSECISPTEDSGSITLSFQRSMHRRATSAIFSTSRVLTDSEDDTHRSINDHHENDHESMISRLRSQCTEAERELLGNIADLSNIPADYSHMHADQLAISTLENNTHLSMIRRDQFNYGILQSYRLTGGILFGPPGTGKTMLAQAVARKSNVHLLSISSGDVFQKAWGDDEKVIRAAFSLARRLHPCIMFIDEADGMLGSRKEEDKKHVRAMLSEFLREWDGVSDQQQRNPFVLLATNRPWDVDPAVLRRAPARILVDKPNLDQRKEILRVLLRGETLDKDLSVDFIATRARLFSGSDLKSLCVSAALKCVQDQVPDEKGEYSQDRVLCKGHFEFAFQSIKPSTTNQVLSKRLLEFQRNGA